MSDPNHSIAIVGVGCRFAGAGDLHAYAEQMLAGADGFGPIPKDRWDHRGFHDTNPRKADKAYTTRGGFIEDIKSFPAVALQIPPRRLEVMDPQQRLTLEVALQAVADAGLTPEELPRRTGVYMGVTAVEFRTLIAGRILAQMMAQGELGEGMEDPSALAAAVDRLLPPRPFTAPGVLSNMIAATVAQEMGLTGPAFTMDAACASSLVAVSDAVAALRTGQIEVALAGGVYLCLTPEHHIAFSRIGAISPSGRCLPFDARADGFVQGDGGAVVMLKRLADAERDGDRVYAIIEGVGINNDGGGEGPMAPVLSGQKDVIELAWADAGLEPTYLGYMETHGTGTSVGDKTELAALKAVLGERVQRAALGSAKANVGHTMSAAGVAGLVRAALALHRGVVPPMAHFESAKADLGLGDSPFYIPKSPTRWTGPSRLAAVSSFGFGGTNVHAVLRAAPTAEPDLSAPQHELVLMSAPDEAALRELAGRTAAAVEADAANTVAGVARAWQKRRQQPARLAVVADSRESLIRRLRAVAAGEHVDGVALGAIGEADPKMAWLYPGQGAQKIGMLRALKARFPIIEEALAEADAVARAVCDRPITELLYPELRDAPIEDEAAQRELTDTRNAQPALMAVGHALTAVLTQVGLKPEVVAGHSVGEFTAAVAGGVLPFDAGLRWVSARGRAMSDHPGDPGAMVAIHAAPEAAEAFLVEGAVIANHNHPKQVVISGGTEAVKAVEANARAAGVRATLLEVSHGFHSPVFSSLDLSDVVDGLPLVDPAVTVASCIQDHPYTDAAEARAVFKAHATSPVRFVDTVNQCVAAGADLFLQVGVGGPLAAFTRGALASGTHKGALTLSSHKEDQSVTALLLTLGKLWVAGAPVDAAAITGAAPTASVPPEVLPRTVHWHVRETGTGRTTLVGATGEAAQAPEVIRAAPLAAEVTPADAPGDVPAVGDVTGVILEAVARVSAYPRGALKAEMRLMEDLGFDSLMLVDLGEQLVKAIDGLDGLPQELFVNQPRIQDLIDYVEAPAPAAVEVDDDAPLRRYHPDWLPAPLPAEPVGWPRGLKVAVEGPGVSAEAVKAAARAQGARLVAAFECDVLLWCADGVPRPDLKAIVDGGIPAPDPAAELIAALARLDKANRRPGVLVVRDAEDAWAEALTGAVRALDREWPEARCQSLRFTAELPTEARVEALVRALTSADASVDALYTAAGRSVAGALPMAEVTAPFIPQRWGWTVITGGMRSVGLALAKYLLEAGGMVILVGRRGPSSEAEDLWHSHRDRVEFVKADVLDRAGLTEALTKWRGRITSVVHSAGLLADGAVGAISEADGAAVRAVKVQGWLNTLHACGRSTKRTLAIGSWAGRFGNRHQVHYAAANAQMAAVAEALPIPAVVSEFGPWVDSAMGQTLSEGVKATMRQEGVDFVGTAAGIQALLADLGEPCGVSTRGRSVPRGTRRVARQLGLSLAEHPYLSDHAIGGVPVMPMASVADLAAWAAEARAPFALEGLRLYRGITVPTSGEIPLTVQVDGEKVRVVGAEDALHYTAAVRPVTEAPHWSPVEARGPVGVSLEAFYREVTFHGPTLQGLTALEGAGDGVIRGRVRTGAPKAWMPGTERARWAVDPLALDSAFQLAAALAWVKFQRGGTPTSIGRLVQIAPLPEGEIWAEARLVDQSGDRFTADVALLDASGELLLLATGVNAELRAVAEIAEAPAPTPERAEPGSTTPVEGFAPKAEWVDFAQMPEYQDLRMRLDMVEAIGLKNPYFDVHQGTATGHSLIDDRDCLNYSSYNYLGYSGDPRVLDAVDAAMRQYGTSVSASRVASGERPFHGELERGLAAAQGSEAALVMASGHATNVTTIGHLFGPRDLILHDELIHDSCLQGIKLSGAARRSYRHEDAAHLEGQLAALRPHYEKVLILTEGVYSMDGDVSNTPAFVALKKRYGCLLMVDEAHSFGTIGATGRGVTEHWGLQPGDVDIYMGTLSKSLAAMGGWIAGCHALVEYLRYTTPGFVFAAGLPPTLGVAALTSLTLMGQEPERVQALQRNAAVFLEALKARGVNTGPARGESPVVPVITGNSLHAMHLSARLLEDGVNARPIVYPAVADDAARLRFFLCALHTPEELRHTARLVAEHLARIREELGS